MGDTKNKVTKSKTHENKYDPTSSTMSLGDHLEELRWRLILALAGLVVSTIICLFFGKQIFDFIQGPYTQLRQNNPELPKLIYLAPSDAFVVYMKVSLISGLIISSPWIFYQLWMFVVAGLYPNERRYVYIAVPFCATLFIAGALFFLFVIASISLRFFIAFGNYLGNEPMWTLQKYISFITILMLVFGIGFQTPVVVYVLNRTGLVSIEALRRSRKYVLLLIVIIAAIATPPDVVSQITLAIPLYLLFELGILLSYLAGRKKTS
jgi:sec-independent protein translocase protein TatC